MNVLISTVILLVAQAAAVPDTNSLTIEQQASGADGAMRYYRVAAGDLNGDGKADKAELQLRCDGGLATDAVLMPAAPAAKRQHKPMTVTKEWGAATPQLMQTKVGYNVKKVEGSGARTAGIPVTLIGSGPLCALATIGR